MKQTARQKRLIIWEHNRFFGCAAMMEANLSTIIRSATATDETKAHCQKMRRDSRVLRELLRKRRDQ